MHMSGMTEISINTSLQPLPLDASVHLPETLDNHTGWLYKSHPGVAVSVVLGFILGMVAGVPGNVLIIATIATQPKLKTTSNLFVANLAIADVITCAVVYPVNMIGILHGKAFLFNITGLCTASATIGVMSVFCSVTNMVVISFNRYINISHPKVYPRLFSWRRSFVVCICLWLSALLQVLCNHLGWGGYAFDPLGHACIFDRTAALSYTIFFMIVGNMGPTILIMVFYGLIFHTVRMSRLKIAQSQGGQQGKSSHTVRLAKMLFITYVCFLMCWTPYNVVTLKDPYNQLPAPVHVYPLLLGFLNSSINFFIYGVTNRQFRQAYIKFLHLDKYWHMEETVAITSNQG